jgi:hypothetical protein
MEATAQSVEDYLIDSLSFKLKPGASYITNRRSVSFFPHGGNQYSVQGVKVIKLVLTGDQWLDPGTVRIQFALRNLAPTAPQQLRVISGPWSFFRRVRILAGGQILEDMDDYNRIHEMFQVLQAPIHRFNDDIMGFGRRYDLQVADANYFGIAGQQSKVVMFKLLSGIFNQEKFLPIRYMPITIELELTSIVTDPIIYPLDIATGNVVNPAGVGPFMPATCSNQWQIEDVQIKCDVCTLDNALDNEYAQHLLSGKSLPINYNTYVSQMQQLVGQNPVINITRALTRLKSIFFTMNKARPGEGNQANGTHTIKTFNDFWHSMAAGGVAGEYDPGREIEFQVQIGSKLYPEYPMRSTAEVFYQLNKTLGIHTSSFYGVDITPLQWQNYRFIVGIDTEKVLSAGFTGLNTKAGDLLTIKIKHVSADPLSQAELIQVVLHADMVLNIRDTGVEVLE